MSDARRPPTAAWPEPYVRRSFRRLGLWEEAGFRLKAYAIHPDGPPPDAALTDAARRHAAEILPGAAAAEGDPLPLGFLILHRGATGSFLLMDWWAHRDVICQRTALARRAGEFVATDRPLLACLWEMIALAHERDAFVRHLCRPDPDPDAYLADWLPDGRY